MSDVLQRLVKLYRLIEQLIATIHAARRAQAFVREPLPNIGIDVSHNAHHASPCESMESASDARPARLVPSFLASIRSLDAVCRGRGSDRFVRDTHSANRFVDSVGMQTVGIGQQSIDLQVSARCCLPGRAEQLAP